MVDGEDQIDDLSVVLQVQQFFDEWSYRCLGANLALTWDRSDCIIRALEIFEHAGVPLSADEKVSLAAMEESKMIQVLAEKMPQSLRKTSEHFFLQVQLVLSLAMRVRASLKEGPADVVAKTLEDGDSGIGQQVLKQAVIEASREVGEIRSRKSGWEKTMDKRFYRLSRCAAEAANAAELLEETNTQIARFAIEQNAKAGNMFASMAAGNNKVLTKQVFSAWMEWLNKYKSEKHIHQKYRDQIEHSEKKLLEYKLAKKGLARSMLARSSAGKDSALMQEALGAWAACVEASKWENELGGKLKRLQDKLDSIQGSHKKNAKKVLARMTGHNDDALKLSSVQEWVAMVAEAKMEREMEKQVAELDKKMKDYLSKKADNTMGVLGAMAGASDTGLLFTMVTEWSKAVRTEKKERELQEEINRKTSKFAFLKARQKGAAGSSAARATELASQNLMMATFMAWATEGKLSRVIRHYDGVLGTKKHQLVAVQEMFKDFAGQLEQSLGNSPRSQRRSQRGPGAGKGAVPPQLPA